MDFTDYRILPKTTVSANDKLYSLFYVSHFFLVHSCQSATGINGASAVYVLSDTHARTHTHANMADTHTLRDAMIKLAS